jgi:hypothetical protein
VFSFRFHSEAKRFEAGSRRKNFVKPTLTLARAPLVGRCNHTTSNGVRVRFDSVVVTRPQLGDGILASEVRMLTLILVFSGALVIMAIAAALNRRRESLPYGARTSKTDAGAYGWCL